MVYNKNNELAAYFTLAFKILDLPVGRLSATLRKQLERFGRKVENLIQIPCVLLAQWSKNFNISEMISGTDLLNYVIDAIFQVQRLIGGSFMFLECEAEKTHLVEHYKKMGFVAISERTSNENAPLIQFIKKI